MTDRVPIFNDVFAFRKIFQCKFVSGKNILIQGDFLSVHREFFTSRKWGDVVNYDLCINSASYGIEGSVRLIERLLLQKG